jgi:hypothetical protein
MGAKRIPEDVAAAIEECWPDGVIEEFDTDESFFHDIHAKLERDLRKIPGASLLWQTEAEDDSAYWDDDDEPPPSGPDFQSYHVFFLAPQGSEFEFETETENLEEPDPEDPGGRTDHCYVSGPRPVRLWRGGLFGHSVGGHSLLRACPLRTARHPDILGESAFAKLENLRERIAKVLAKHGVVVLDQAILDLPAPDLKHDSEVFLEGKKLTVRDAFFFRGV